MGRIRSLKPEFPQSESMGRVSREARLAFILLWTLADDEGRLRGNSRMLASLLFPYDDDAPGLIDGWMGELEREDCIARYRVHGDSYIQIAHWRSHQKIDHPSKSKLPPFGEDSEILAKPRETSINFSLDQGRDQGREKKDILSGKPDPAAQPAAEHAGINEQCAELLAYLNAKAGKKFRPVDANLRLLAARLREATADEVRAVIDDRVSAWKGDAKMGAYLRPETLFNATKFAGYLGQLGTGSASTPTGSVWWQRAGFATEGDAADAGCWQSNWREFQDGQRIAEVPA